MVKKSKKTSNENELLIDLNNNVESINNNLIELNETLMRIGGSLDKMRVILSLYADIDEASLEKEMASRL